MHIKTHTLRLLLMSLLTLENVIFHNAQREGIGANDVHTIVRGMKLSLQKKKLTIDF